MNVPSGATRHFWPPNSKVEHAVMVEVLPGPDTLLSSQTHCFHHSKAPGSEIVHR